MRLTKIQEKLLMDVLENDGLTTVETYPPAKKLVEFGLCEFRRGRYGGCSIVITDAGKRFLQERL